MSWTQDTELLASLLELVHNLLAVTVAANSKSPHPMDPLQVTRPSWIAVVEPTPTVVSHRELFRRARG